MLERNKVFGNYYKTEDMVKAERNKAKFKKKYGDDSLKQYHLSAISQPVLDDLGTANLVMSEEPLDLSNLNPVVIGNIRMGFGHYRISMAMCSAAKAMGYDPLWLDLNSFKETATTKIISSQNDLYSLGSRLSSKSKLFNYFVWEPTNYEGFRKLKQNVNDEYASELMTGLFADFPKDIPYIATHVWPAQAAVHAGMSHVVNAIPDNWQMGLHLADGAIHTIQTYNSYFGYRTLRGMQKGETLKPMSNEDLKYVGHYIDHELVSNIELDCERRMARGTNNYARRYLLTVGGAGSQIELFANIIRHLQGPAKEGKACLFVNVGDHKKAYDALCKQIPELKEAPAIFENYEEVKKFVSEHEEDNLSGIYFFYDKDIFSAVYTTNLLMRISDVLVTKPSELAFYPIPKLFIHRVGGHEKWGAIHSAELGDGTYECETIDEVRGMIDLLQDDPTIIEMMCKAIIENKRLGVYNGAYEAVKLAVGGKK